MTPEERDALINYLPEIERFTEQCVGQFESLLLEKEAPPDERERAVKTLEATFAAQLDQLRGSIKAQKQALKVKAGELLDSFPIERELP